jgi:hypothetical protein
MTSCDYGETPFECVEKIVLKCVKVFSSSKEIVLNLEL